MEIHHVISEQKFWLEKENQMAYVIYQIHQGGLDIKHTYVPQPLEGQGIASQLVKHAYDYALEEGLTPLASCTYAQHWLKRHPEYSN